MLPAAHNKHHKATNLTRALHWSVESSSPNMTAVRQARDLSMVRTGSGTETAPLASRSWSRNSCAIQGSFANMNTRGIQQCQLPYPEVSQCQL